MEKKGNDCYNCPYCRELTGSAHKACVHPDFSPHILAAVSIMKNQRVYEPGIIIDEIGRRGGWANWPVNFDPTWITCNLKIETDEPR